MKSGGTAHRTAYLKVFKCKKEAYKLYLERKSD